MKLRIWLSSAAVGALMLAGAAAWADPPQRVGRVALIRGDVSVQPTDQDDWEPATRNYPVTQGEAVWTEQGANAELQIGPVDVFLDGETEVDVDQLDYGVMQLSLPQGAIHVEMARVPDGGMRIETPQGEVRLTQAGAYRIDAGASEEDDPDTLLVTVLSGRAEIAGPGVLTPILRGQTGEVDNGYRISIRAGGANALDDFARRQLADERYNDAPVYVSDEYTGYEDLDAYGDWEDTADYGRVWYPRAVAIDWAPYHYGHWAYVSPWGWTWIDDAPWGFAPFHYGRWTQIRGRWCWAPGERVVRPVYAPALVSFIGGGPGVGVGVSVGWIPLAPREIYRPYYSVSTTYVRNINITTVDRRVVNTLTVENIRRSQDNVRYHNDHARTFVRQEDFSRAAPVQRIALKGAFPQAGGRGPQPFDINKVKAAPQPRGDRHDGPHGDGRVDQRRIAMKAPTAGVAPNRPGAPPSQAGGRPTAERGSWNGGARADRRGGERTGVGNVQTRDGRGGPPPASQGAAPRGPSGLSGQAAVGANATGVRPQQPGPGGDDGRGLRGRHPRDFGQGPERDGVDHRPGVGVNAPPQAASAPNNASPNNGGDRVGRGERFGRDGRRDGGDNGERFRRGGQPSGAPAPQIQVAPQPQPAQQQDRHFDGRRFGPPGGGQQPAAQANDRGSPGDAGGRFGRRGDFNRGDEGNRDRERRGGGSWQGNPQPTPPQPAHAAPFQPPRAQPQPPHPQGGGQPQGRPQQDRPQQGGDNHDRRHRGGDNH
jgi:hypothetical protein